MLLSPYKKNFVSWCLSGYKLSAFSAVKNSCNSCQSVAKLYSASSAFSAAGCSVSVSV